MVGLHAAEFCKCILKVSSHDRVGGIECGDFPRYATITNQVAEDFRFARPHLALPENGEATWHGDLRSDFQIGQRLPSFDGEERMGQRTFNKASEPRGDSERRLDTVIQKRPYIREMKLEIASER